MKEAPRSVRHIFSVAIATCFVFGAGPAFAESATDRARAQELFDSAMDDVEAGHFAEACPKFAASQAADPKTSTLLNLGSCYERLGKKASAWGAYREAQGLALRSGRADLEKAAKERANALANALVRLTVEVPEASRIPGLVVTRDGTTIGEGEWGVGIPVDAGEHVISAEAPGHVAWRTNAAVEGGDVSVEVPALDVVVEDKPFPVDLGDGPPPEPSWWTPQRTTGMTLAGVGAASIVTGLVLALVAKGNYDDARDACGHGTLDCPPRSVSRAEDARTLATGGTITIAAGAAFVAGGLAIAIFEPWGSSSQPKPSAKLGLMGPQAVGVFGQW